MVADKKKLLKGIQSLERQKDIHWKKYTVSRDNGVKKYFLGEINNLDREIFKRKKRL